MSEKTQTQTVDLPVVAKLSLLDVFAAAALVGLVQGADDDEIQDFTIIAEMAFDAAEAMLDEAERRRQPEESAPEEIEDS